MATALKDKLVTLEDLQQAYSKLKDALDDIGEVSTANVTISWSGYNNANSIAKVAKCGSICELTLVFVPTSGASAFQTGDQLALLPSGYRPVIPIRAAEIGLVSSTSNTQVAIDTDGTIRALRDGSNSRYRYHVFYICA